MSGALRKSGIVFGLRNFGILTWMQRWSTLTIISSRRTPHWPNFGAISVSLDSFTVNIGTKHWTDEDNDGYDLEDFDIYWLQDPQANECWDCWLPLRLQHAQDVTSIRENEVKSLAVDQLQSIVNEATVSLPCNNPNPPKKSQLLKQRRKGTAPK